MTFPMPVYSAAASKASFQFPSPKAFASTNSFPVGNKPLSSIFTNCTMSSLSYINLPFSVMLSPITFISTIGHSPSPSNYTAHPASAPQPRSSNASTSPLPVAKYRTPHPRHRKPATPPYQPLHPPVILAVPMLGPGVPFLTCFLNLANSVSFLPIAITLAPIATVTSTATLPTPPPFSPDTRRLSRRARARCPLDRHTARGDNTDT
jgi:hypothetical protein